MEYLHSSSSLKTWCFEHCKNNNNHYSEKMSHQSHDESTSSTITDIGHTMQKLAVNNTRTAPAVEEELGSYVHQTAVTNSDILSGRGNGVAGHEGNKFYLQLIKDHQQAYQGGPLLSSDTPSPKQKKQIAMKIIDTVKGQNPPGRFLKSSKNSDEAFMWFEQDDQSVMNKVLQALREKPKKKKAQGKRKPLPKEDTVGF